MKKSLALLLSPILAAILFTGCQSTGAKAPLDTTKYDQENKLNAVLLDSRAQKAVTYSGIQENRRPDESLQDVAVNVRNRKSKRVHVQINCEFKDAQGFVLDRTPFENLILDENAQQTVRFTAMNPQVKRYTVRVRMAR